MTENKLGSRTLYPVISKRRKGILNNLILAINPGSSSVKFGLYNIEDGIDSAVCRGVIEGFGSNSSFTIKTNCRSDVELAMSIDKFQKKVASAVDAYKLIVEWLSCNLMLQKIGLVCYRVVHGGNYFSAPVEINSTVLKKLTSLIPLAPLHQPIELEAVNLFMRHLSGSRHVACFDTAFHRTMPKVAQSFALPERMRELGIKPYGFHGLSYQFIVGKVAEVNKGSIPRRLVIAHLGSGASMCALLSGESISTSMSFSPLDGLPMATRCGELDASAVLYMIEELELSTSEVSDILNKQSGLLGLSGISGDVRVLMNSDSEKARLALDYYIHQICRELGAMIATLKGLDALIFTGGVGSNNNLIRERICKQFEWQGVSLDPEANQQNENIISHESSRITVYALNTDEELMMAQLVSRNMK